MQENLMKELREVLDAEKLVTARLVDAVARNSQLAAGATPEMRELFEQWISLISSQIMREFDGGEIIVADIAAKIGIKETSLLSLIIYMQRTGRLKVSKISFAAGTGQNEDICDCIREEK